jgi:choline dehydrogenase
MRLCNSTIFLFFAAIIGALAYIPDIQASIRHRVNPRQITPTISEQYDYIIIGGGTAGLVMASRLSENSSISVAVIEAGGYYEQLDPVFSTTPGLDSDGVGSDPSSTNDIDWNFVTTPQCGINNRQIHYARGKCLGGR